MLVLTKSRGGGAPPCRTLPQVVKQVIQEGYENIPCPAYFGNVCVLQLRSHIQKRGIPEIFIHTIQRKASFFPLI